MRNSSRSPRLRFTVHGDTNPVRVAACILARMASPETVDLRAFDRVAKKVGEHPEANGFVVTDAIAGLEKLCKIGRFAITVSKRTGKFVPVFVAKTARQRRKAKRR
jgi:hypothetical protein